eukprot:TRINITY_DN32453_c0_g1_i1.p1 TRINITY_DN32453_c0_g1~~TRINITY_DN32453_c0_g1_i1.p1  ORF type:complete len:593 (-),score=69.98 TRINITY_DN32453_c0_g1_i1:147-1925(-)
MDKNMINIDDLIRQRLSGGEEEERAGAWLRMRELLDEKQPVRAAAIFNWKRVLSYAAGLVLLAVAGIGGYNAMHSQKDADNTAVNRYSRTGNAMLSGTVQDNSNANTATDNANAVVATKHSDAKKLINDATTNKQSGMVASTGKDAGLLVTKHSNTTNTINTPAPVNTIKENQTTNKPSSEKTNTDNNRIVAANSNIDNTPAKTTAEVKSTTDSKLQAANMNAVNNVVAATNSNKTQQLPVEVTNPRYRKQVKTIDSVAYITTKESGRKGIRKIDTIAQGMVATEKLVDVPVEVATTASATRKAQTEILPSATLMERNSQEVLNAAMAADSKKDSKQSKNNYNPRRFEEMIQNMNVDLGKVSIHPGLVAGISSSVGAYNMMGVQLGISGVMEISDRWGMFAELKGVYRFGNGKSLINNYYTVDRANPDYLGNNTYSYRWDSVAHSFNISSSTSIELPIAVRYSANRLNAFAGVNGTYNFAVKVDEYSQNYTRSYVTNSTNVQPLVEKWGENTIIGYDAFKARFMLGYVVGAGYQVTPNIGVDFRATQPFMESNAGKKSSAIISKQLYRAPSFQLNFTYKFTNNKYKPRELNY